MIVDADLKWITAYKDIGRIEQSWGELAVARCKPLENELARRLEPVLSSLEGIEYFVKKTGRSAAGAASLGLLVGLLADFPRLSTTMQEAIVATGVQLQHDGETVGQLRTLQQYRNRGAHPHPFRARDLMDVKSLLFEQGLLHRFAHQLAF